MTLLSYYEQIQEAVAYVREKVVSNKFSVYFPKIGLILGSGLGDIGDLVEDPVYVKYSEIPHFPISTVEGHEGRFVLGMLEGKKVIVMQGRFHYYEGYSMKQVVFPVYVMQQLGVSSIVITNAAGGMNRSFKAGDILIIRDHLNMTGDHPLIGPNFSELGVRFPDMSNAYNPNYIDMIKRIANSIINEDGSPLILQEGVYCGITGPTYMTAAELTMLAKVGGDAIGMSTVAEVIAAAHCGLKVLALSCITDMAIGEELEPVTHEQVISVANQTKPKLTKLVTGFIRNV